MIGQKHNYKELLVWKSSMDLVTETYKMTATFPREEMFGLMSQMRRAAVSITSNIAEGYGRGTDPQILHFLDISQGSAYELETQCNIALRLNFIQQEHFDQVSYRILGIQKMIYALQKSIRNKVSST
jgi:four helix bundle protein